MNVVDALVENGIMQNSSNGIHLLLNNQVQKHTTT